jgi:hypothetical protein
MNNRSLIAIFVVCFLLTVAFVSIRRGDWNRADPRGPSASTIGGATPGATASARAAAAQAPTANGPPYRSAATTDPVEPVRAPAYPDHSQADAPRDPAAMEVPVIVTVEDSPATGRREAIIRNISPQPLDVRVTAINPPAGTRSTVQASIPPRRKTSLTDQGLVVVTGSQILVESPPYLQQSTTVY